MPDRAVAAVIVPTATAARRDRAPKEQAHVRLARKATVHRAAKAAQCAAKVERRDGMVRRSAAKTRRNNAATTGVRKPNIVRRRLPPSTSISSPKNKVSPP
jgi:hypothetical protein